MTGVDEYIRRKLAFYARQIERYRKRLEADINDDAARRYLQAYTEAEADLKKRLRKDDHVN